MTKDAWATYTTTKITRRIKTINSVNYAAERASDTASFMSSGGSKKWCIIDDQLYYCNTDNVSDFALVQNPTPTDNFISYGTCSPDGSIVYLIKNDGRMWKSIDDGNTLIAL